MIKRIVASVLAAAVLSVPAWAEITVRQNADGTADHVGRTGQRTNVGCLGGVVLPAFFMNNTLSTGVVISPITDAVLRNVIVGRTTGQTSGSARISLWTYQSGLAAAAAVSPVQFLGLPSGQVSQAFINLTAGGITQTNSLSTIAQMNAQRVTGDTIRMIKNTFEAGQVIAVQSDGGATAVLGGITGVALVQLCPR